MREGLIDYLKAALAAATLSIIFGLAACTTTPSGEKQLSAEGKAALDLAVRIGVRHLVTGTGAEARALRVRLVIDDVLRYTNEDSSLANLHDIALTAINKSSWSELDKADARDLLDTIGAAVAAQIDGSNVLKGSDVVRVREFLLQIEQILASSGV
jgi:sugar phosphate isomerase/epimerase